MMPRSKPIAAVLGLLLRTIRNLLLASGVGLFLLLLGTSTLHAQWAVVDVDAIAEITKEVSNGAQQIQQLQQQYNQMMAMAQQAQGLFRYRGPQNIWQAFNYADQYATLTLWATGANSGDAASIQNAYAQNTTLANIDQSLTSINQGTARARSSLYATQSIMDGNNLALMQTVGQIHAAASQYQNAISQLENDDENPDGGVQAQLAVAQRTSNAMILQLRSQQDTNNLLSQIALQQLAQSKLIRDTIADATNRALDDQQALQDAGNMTTGYTTSLQNWSIH